MCGRKRPAAWAWATTPASRSTTARRIPFRAVTDVDLLRNRLSAWLKAHPLVDGALPAAEANDAAAGAELARNVEAAGGRCDGPCPGLVRWYRDTDTNQPPLVDEAEVRGAAREAIPGAEDDIARGWSTIPGARLGFLFFHLDLPPGAMRSVVVRYRQRASVDRAAHVNPTYRFDYLLSPAKRWAAFGPIDVTVRVPEDARFASTLPFHAEGGVQRAEPQACRRASSPSRRCPCGASGSG